MRLLLISTVEHEMLDECDSSFEKYQSLPDDFVPTQKDYDDFIENCGHLFLVLNTIPMDVICYYEMSRNTARNALLTGIPLMLDYRKTGKLAKSVPLGSYKDAFGNQSFELIKTKTGFILKSKSIDIRKDKRPEYEFTLPRK